MSESTFSKLAKIDCKEHLEKKNGFTYLSWPWAVKILREADPKARWDVIRFDGMPFCKTDAGYFVEVAVTVDGVTLSQIHPVLDYKNKPIQSPDAFHINTSIQRCLVKAIALHGLGLYVYAGEDLPEGQESTPITPTSGVGDDLSPETKEALQALVDQIQRCFKDVPVEVGAGDAVKALAGIELSPEEKVYVWKFLDSKQRSSIKKAMEKAK